MTLTTKLATTAILAGIACLGAGCKNDLGDFGGSGTLELREARLGAQVPGVVLSVRVEEGDSAKPGDTLVVLDTVSRAIQRDQAKAAAMAARASWELTSRGSRAEDIGQALAQTDVARAQMDNALDHFQRTQGLAQQGAATPAQLESARTQLASSQAQLKALQATADRLVKGSRVEEIARSRALYEQTAAALRGAQDLLDRSIVRAPAGSKGRWTVTERLVEPGEMVQPGGQVVSLADPGRAELRIYLSEKAAAVVKVADKASVYLDSDPSKALSATVASVSNTAEFTPKNVQTAGERAKLVYAVTLRVTNPGNLKSGMPATAKIEVGN